MSNTGQEADAMHKASKRTPLEEADEALLRIKGIATPASSAMLYGCDGSMDAETVLERYKDCTLCNLFQAIMREVEFAEKALQRRQHR